MVDFNNTRFMSGDFQKLYYTDLPRMKLLLKSGSCLDKVEEKLSGFHARLIATGWMYFASEPCYANEHWVYEF